jgi:hypothetical protein
MNSDFYTEVYDQKTQNVKIRPKANLGICDECKGWGGHKVDCSQVTIERVKELLDTARKQEESIRLKAARWLEHLQRATGKIALLKHENNKLRWANEKLTADRRVTEQQTKGETDGN